MGLGLPFAFGLRLSVELVMVSFRAWVRVIVGIMYRIRARVGLRLELGLLLGLSFGFRIMVWPSIKCRASLWLDFGPGLELQLALCTD